jgi:hypothetical protein
MEKELIHEQLSEDVIGAAMTVLNTLDWKRVVR